MTTQLAFDFNRHYVVRNCWSECYHVCDEHNVTTLWPDQPGPFASIQDAIDWAAAHGIKAELCTRTYGYGNLMQFEVVR